MFSPLYLAPCSSLFFFSTTNFAALLRIVSRPQISKGSVICLQEVGLQWAGDLHVYFMAKGYSFVTAHYGKAFNNYMGEFMRSIAAALGAV